MASVANQIPAPAAQGLQTLASNSSFIAAFEYDATNLTLVTFLKSGAIYEHKFFLPNEWTDLQTSQNHGKHWSTHVKGKHLSVTVKKAKAPKSEIKHRRYV